MVTLARRRFAASSRSRQIVLRRVALTVALIAVALIPLPVLASDTTARVPSCQGGGCHGAQPVSAQRWAVKLDPAWSAGTGPGTAGDGGTMPANGQAAYVAVGGGLAVIGTGLTLTGYTLDHGTELWQRTLAAPQGSAIGSVRAWQGVITAGVLAPDGHSRTEMVIDAESGAVLRHYPAAVFGGAVFASGATTVVIGPAAVTSYNNATSRVRWQRTAATGQSWQVDEQTKALYLTQSAGGYPSAAPAPALKVINLTTGAERVLSFPIGQHYSGTLATAADGAVLFASPAGVTAYDGSTGGELWSLPHAVPEGADPVTGLVDLTLPSGVLAGVDPQTGEVRASVPATVASGAADLYVVRDGVALGLDGGANGTAWGYDMAKGRVTWTSPLPWPHFFADVSGLGGSADASGDLVVVTACPRLAVSQGICANPELVALNV